MHDIRPYLPELFNQPGTLLYIGARSDAHSWLDELIEVGNEVDILEVWHENVQGLIPLYNETCMIMWGDIREIDLTEYDYVFYWHGPEHLEPHEIEPVLNRLEQMAEKTLALACPYGVYPQGAHAGNPYEIHKSTLYPEFFELLGFEVATDGKPNEPGGEIVVWKRK